MTISTTRQYRKCTIKVTHQLKQHKILSSFFFLELPEFTFLEWDKKLRYKYDHRVRKERIIDPESEEPEPPPEPEVDDFEIGCVPAVKYQKLEPSASEYLITIEDNIYAETRQSLINIVPTNVINMRRYLLLGGIYQLNLYYQPPQPKEMVSYDTVLTVRK